MASAALAMAGCGGGEAGRRDRERGRTGKVTSHHEDPFNHRAGERHRVVGQVRTHKGSPYFAHLLYQYVNAKGVTKQLRYWSYTYRGASVPGWH